MRHRNIKERRRLILEFAYQHREEILAIEYARQKAWRPRSGLKLPDDAERLVQKVREDPGYSPKTISFDIWLYLVRQLKHYLKNGRTATNRGRDRATT